MSASFFNFKHCCTFHLLLLTTIALKFPCVHSSFEVLIAHSIDPQFWHWVSLPITADLYSVFIYSRVESTNPSLIFQLGLSLFLLFRFILLPLLDSKQFPAIFAHISSVFLLNCQVPRRLLYSLPLIWNFGPVCLPFSYSSTPPSISQSLSRSLPFLPCQDTSQSVTTQTIHLYTLRPSHNFGDWAYFCWRCENCDFHVRKYWHDSVRILDNFVSLKILPFAWHCERCWIFGWDIFLEFFMY